MTPLHLTLTPDDPRFQRAMARSKTGALGHIGTHFDCYTVPPAADRFELDAVVLDCTKGMPDLAACRALADLKGRALVLRTANEETNGYASPEYFARQTFLTEEELRAVLAHRPEFIIIDSHGIGKSGEIHTSRDKLCESFGCHVIENAALAALAGRTEVHLEILVDTANPSTGKPCRLLCD